jgi:hypothetical protein
MARTATKKGGRKKDTGTVSLTGDVEDHALSVPTAVRKWKDIDYTNRKTQPKVKS